MHKLIIYMQLTILPVYLLLPDQPPFSVLALNVKYWRKAGYVGFYDYYFDW